MRQMVFYVIISAAFLHMCSPYHAFAQAAEEDISGLSLSVGESSLLYDDVDMDNLRMVLEVYELNAKYDLSAITPQDIGDDQEDMGPLPVFYYSSLVRRNYGNWGVWINGEQYTNNTKQEVDGVEAVPLKVSLLSNDEIRVTWRPRKKLNKVIQAWQTREQVDEERLYRHRLSDRQGNSEFDIAEGSLTFTMKPNQTYIVDSFEVVEGKYEQKDLAGNSAMASTANASSSLTSGAPQGQGSNQSSGDIFNLSDFTDKKNSPMNQIKGLLGKFSGGVNQEYSQQEAAEDAAIQELQKEILKSIFNQ